jgi:hypothetical protein
MDLHLYSLIRIHDVVLNELNTRSILLLSVIIHTSDASTTAILLLLMLGNSNPIRLCEL